MSLLNISLKEMCVSSCAWAGVEVYATEHRLWTMQTIQSLGLSYGPHHRTVSVSPTNEQKTMRNQIKSVHLKYVIWRSTLCSGNMEELFRETKSLEQHFIGNFIFQSFYLCAHFHHAYISLNTYYLTVCFTICYPCTLTSIISVSFYFMISSTANPHTVISSLHIFFKFNSNAKWICDNWTYIHTRIFYVSFFHQICSW